MKSFEERSTFASAAAPDAVWRELCASGAIERDGAFPDVRYEREERADAPAVDVGRATLGPLAIEWEEPPWSWEAPRRVTVVRRFRRGPFARYVRDVVVVPDGGGSRIERTVTLEARDGFGAMLAPFVLARERTAGGEPVARAADAAAEAGATGASPAALARFADAIDALRPHAAEDAAIAARLAAHVEHAGEAALAAMRPYALAAAWQLPRARVVAAMLAAARAGILDPSWRIACDGCGGWCAEETALANVGSDARCARCDAPCPVELDRTVELVFDGRGDERTARDPQRPEGPRGAPLAPAQLVVAARLTATIRTTLEPGPHRIRAGGAEAHVLVAAGARGRTLRVAVGENGLRVEPDAVAPGTVQVEVINDGVRDVPVRISASRPATDRATAAEVAALQAFRDLFPFDAPAAGAVFALRELTVLWFELADAPRLYADFGDVRALALVAEHHEALHDVVAEQRGAIVKFAGDAALTAFTDPRDAIVAAIRFARSAPLPVRAGGQLGPCVALRANERFEIAGATVDLAQRIARGGGAGEILLGAALAGDSRVSRALGAAERGTLSLRGAPAPLDVVRIRTQNALP